MKKIKKESSIMTRLWITRELSGERRWKVSFELSIKKKIFEFTENCEEAS